MNRVKKDNLIVVVADKNKDRRGRIISVDTKKNRILVQGCDMVTKCTKQTPGKPQDGIVDQEAPTDIPNVMLVVDDRATRAGLRERGDKKVRVAKITSKAIG